MKPDNVFLDSRGTCKIADFDLSLQLKPSETSTQCRGTSSYMAPEIRRLTAAKNGGEDISSWPCYSFAVDMFSLAIMVYQMVCPGAEAKTNVRQLLPAFGMKEVTQ